MKNFSRAVLANTIIWSFFYSFPQLPSTAFAQPNPCYHLEEINTAVHPEHYIYQSEYVFDTNRRRAVTYQQGYMWEFDGSGWHGYEAPLNPIPWEFGALAYDSTRKVTMMYGGRTQDGLQVTDGLYAWDGFNWSEPKFAGDRPPAMQVAKMVYDSDRDVLVLFHGYLYPYGKNQLNLETWEFYPSAGAWLLRATTGPDDDATEMVYDAAHQQTLLVGPIYGTGASGTWVWDPQAGVWVLQQSGGIENDYTEFGLAYDSNRGEAILIGGYCGPPQCESGQFLRWDGVEWIYDNANRGGETDAFVYNPFTRRLISAWDSGYNATLAIWDGLPGILTQPESETVCAGDPASFGLAVTDGGGDFAWYKVGQDGVASSSQLLVFQPSQAGDDGEYYCTITNNCGTVTTDHAVLSVLQTPAFLDEGDWPQGICPGTKGLIATPTLLDPRRVTLSLQRFVAGNWQDVSAVLEGDYLSFTPSSPQDTGDYRIVASNGCNSSATGPHHIQVGETFDEQPIDRNVSLCGGFSLSVAVHGVGAVTYQWHRFDVDLVDGESEYGSVISGATTPTLTVTDVRYSDAGAYRCRITDACGPVDSDLANVVLPPGVWQYRTSLTPAPPPRDGGAVAYDAGRGVTVLEGGFTSAEVLDDLWEWDGKQWTQRFPSIAPSPRYGQQMVYDSQDGELLLYGGDNHSNLPINDPKVWHFDGTDWYANAGTSPPAVPTTPPAMDYDSKLHVAMMVKNSTNQLTPNATYYYFPATNTWQSKTVLGQGPTGGFPGVLAYDADRQVHVFFTAPIAGQTGAHETWEWNGTTWSGHNGPHDPPAGGGAMAYDPIARQTVLFGNAGTTQNSRLTNTYVYDGAAWRLGLAGGLGVSPLTGFRTGGMAFDTARKAMVLTGFSPGTDMEVWEYDYLDGIYIFEQPQSMPIIAGQNASFVVDAIGPSLVYFQWRRNGVPLTDGPAPGGGTIIGSTSDSLRIQPAFAADRGIYDCVLSDACGDVHSRQALLGTRAPVDLDGDGDVDKADAAAMLACLSGPNAAESPQCQIDDINGDGHVDLADFLALQNCFAGNGNLVAPECGAQ